MKWYVIPGASAQRNAIEDAIEFNSADEAAIYRHENDQSAVIMPHLYLMQARAVADLHDDGLQLSAHIFATSLVRIMLQSFRCPEDWENYTTELVAALAFFSLHNGRWPLSAYCEVPAPWLELRMLRNKHTMEVLTLDKVDTVKLPTDNLERARTVITFVLGNAEL